MSISEALESSSNSREPGIDVKSVSQSDLDLVIGASETVEAHPHIMYGTIADKIEKYNIDPGKWLVTSTVFMV